MFYCYWVVPVTAILTSAVSLSLQMVNNNKELYAQIALAMNRAFFQRQLSIILKSHLFAINAFGSRNKLV